MQKLPLVTYATLLNTLLKCLLKSLSTNLLCLLFHKFLFAFIFLLAKMTRHKIFHGPNISLAEARQEQINFLIKTFSFIHNCAFKLSKQIFMQILKVFDSSLAQNFQVGI